MTVADIVYGDIIRQVDNLGIWDKDAPVRAKWNDGTPAYTKSILNAQMIFDNGKEILDSILSQKRVPRKDPVQEMFWIWLFKSNDVKFLREVLGCTVWDEWERPDGTIGKAYGWQLRNKKRRVKITQTLMEMYFNGELSDNIERTFDGYVMLDQVDYLIYILKTNPH
jgi:thymidylate synthase